MSHGYEAPAIWRSRSRMHRLASLNGLEEEEQLRDELQEKRASLVEKKLKCDEKVREIRSIIQQSFNVFCVFQGVIINALFTGSASQRELCSLYAIPFSLSLIAYVYFVAEILFELVRIIQAKQDAHRLVSGIKRIEDTRIRSARPPADELYEVYTAADAEDRITSGIPDSFNRGRILFDGYARLILFLSTAFTVVVLVSCKLVLCR